MRKLHPSRKYIRIFAYLMAFHCLLPDGEGFASENFRYWVSENFSENPNVNNGPGQEEFAPTIIELSNVVSDEKKADVILCFDNRPFHQVNFPILENSAQVIKEKNEEIQFCKIEATNNSIGNIREVSGIFDRPQITAGLQVSRSGRQSICEAIFTLPSLFSVLSHKSIIDKQSDYKHSNIRPYNKGWISKDDIKNIKPYLHPDDKIREVRSIDSNFGHLSLSLDKTWDCVAPVFQLYWRAALEHCEKGVEELRIRPEITTISYPLVKKLANKMQIQAKKCQVIDVE